MITYDQLQYIIPPDQALGNKAFASALQQVTGIMYLTLPKFAETVIKVEGAQGLPLIEGLTQAVPPAVANYYTSTLGVNNGPITVTDMIGLPAGVIATPALQDTVTQLNTMNTSALQTIYATMLHVVTNDLNWSTPNPVPPPAYINTIVPVGYPGAGTYADADAAILALIALAQTEITALQSAYPTQCTSLNTDFNNIAQEITSEQNLQTQAQIDFTQFDGGDQMSIYAMLFSLPNDGLDIAPGGMSDYLTAVADQSNIYGQAIIGTLREGRSQQDLNSAGIKSTSNIPLN